MPRYAIGLGSNVGDRLQHMVGAVERLYDFLDQWLVRFPPES